VCHSTLGLGVIKKKKTETASERGGNNSKYVKDLDLKAKALTVLNVQYSLDSGRRRGSSEEGSYLRLIDFCITQL